MRVSVFIATSLDGYIARADGSLDWLEAQNARIPPGEDCGYGDFMADIDVLLMGRATFDQVSTFPEWPYTGKRVIVLSHRPLSGPYASHVARQAGEPKEILAALQSLGARHIYLDGGQTIQAFLRAGLVDDLVITCVPVLLGGGRRLFGQLAADLPLETLSSRSYPFGFVQTAYRVGRALPGGES